MHLSPRLFRATVLPALTAAVLLPTLAHARPFYGSGSGGAIPDNTTTGVASTITVADNFAITAFDNLVITGLTHTWIGDLVGTLTHGGITVDIFDRVGRTTTTGLGNSGNFTAIAAQSYTFVASGATAIPTAGDVAPGTYNVFANGTVGQSSTATGLFSNFAGLSVGGAWTLNLSDRAATDTGSFVSWGFNATVSTTPPPPPPPPGTYTGAGGNIADASTNFNTGVVTPGVTTSDITVADNFAIAAFNSITIEGLTHSLVGDLTIRLEHVNTGTLVDLAYRLGQVNGADEFDGGDSSNLSGNYTFTAGGASLLAAAQQGNDSFDIPGGTYAASTSLDPLFANTRPLSAFNNENVGGTWRLRITDSVEGDLGSFTGWRFNVTRPTVVPEAGSLVLLLPALAALTVARRRKK